MSAARRSPTPRERRIIKLKTGGLCHICGGVLGARWVADHVRPVAKGGVNSIDNFLPACATCNGLKWHRSPKMIRYIMRLGIYCKKEVQNGSTLGLKIEALYDRKWSNAKKRRK